MYQALIILHVLIAVGIITLVLLQQGRGADAGAAFGSGASGTVFGAQGSASFLTRTTAVLATLFFATSLALAILGDTRESTAGFMDTPVEQAAPTDMPPMGMDMKREAPSDVPDLPPIGDAADNAENANSSESPISEDAATSEPSTLSESEPIVPEEGAEATSDKAE